MIIERREYIEAVNYYQADITEEDINELNNDILKDNPNFKPLTENDIREYVKSSVWWARADEKISFQCEWRDEPLTYDLDEYMADWMNDKLWSEGAVDMDVKHVYDVEDYVLK